MLLKYLLKDKLPPRWQYEVWLILAVAVFVPAGYKGLYIWRRPAIWLNTAKTLIERQLDSRYTIAEKTIYNTSVLPALTIKPASVTDMLFVAYTVGCGLFILRYIISYIRLSAVISKGIEDKKLQNRTDRVAKSYGLKSSRVKSLPGLPSAFVFGIFRPVLVLPKDKFTDDKVILHELIHLKNKDLQQKVFWSFVSVFHWPNPFMRYVFNTVNNDMESRCDSRVLQLLAGEERRDYGRILLSMTNEKYPSAFGTTSISNGSGFIAQRIEAIARFKKYPKGMELVALCTVIMLLPAVFETDSGRTNMDGEIKSLPFNIFGNFYRQRQIEEYKMLPCKTLGSATDTFAKGWISERPLFSAAVKPSRFLTEYQLPVEQARFTNQIWTNCQYAVINIQQQNKDRFTADMLFKTYSLPTEEGGNPGTIYVILPIEYTNENGSWKVAATGDYYTYNLPETYDNALRLPMTPQYSGGLQLIRHTEYGDVKVCINNISTFLSRYYSKDLNAYYSQELDTVPNTKENGYGFTFSRDCITTEFIPVQTLPESTILSVGTSVLKNTEDIVNTLLMEKYISQKGRGEMGSERWFTQWLENRDMYSVLYSPLRNKSVFGSYVVDDGEYRDFKAVQIDLWIDGQKADSFKIDIEAGEIIG